MIYRSRSQSNFFEFHEVGNIQNWWDNILGGEEEILDFFGGLSQVFFRIIKIMINSWTEPFIMAKFVSTFDG